MDASSFLIQKHMNSISELRSKGLIHLPDWLCTEYETVMGSYAYGVTNDSADVDIMGICVPPKRLIYPYLAGEIPGFDKPFPRFEQFQKHHIVDETTSISQDVTIYSIVKFFHLAMQCNPNIIDSLYTPQSCVLHLTPIGRHIREKRSLFLCKRIIKTYKGYAYHKLEKLVSGQIQRTATRKTLVERFGYDTKYAYHLIRLMYAAKQMLSTGTLDFTVYGEKLQSVRNGEWTLQEIQDHFDTYEKTLADLALKSELPEYPRELEIRKLLLDCLDMAEKDTEQKNMDIY